MFQKEAFTINFWPILLLTKYLNTKSFFFFFSSLLLLFISYCCGLFRYSVSVFRYCFFAVKPSSLLFCNPGLFLSLYPDEVFGPRSWFCWNMGSVSAELVKRLLAVGVSAQTKSVKSPF